MYMFNCFNVFKAVNSFTYGRQGMGLQPYFSSMTIEYGIRNNNFLIFQLRLKNYENYMLIFAHLFLNFWSNGHRHRWGWHPPPPPPPPQMLSYVRRALDSKLESKPQFLLVLSLKLSVTYVSIIYRRVL